jgi:hypothetical protein
MARIAEPNQQAANPGGFQYGRTRLFRRKTRAAHAYHDLSALRSAGRVPDRKAQLPRNADERDRARFAKAQSYMVRTDDLVGCKNIRCRKRFDVAGIQSVAFL